MNNKNSNMSIFLKGLLLENPVFVLILGTCPTLATSTTVIGAFGMGLAATAVFHMATGQSDFQKQVSHLMHRTSKSCTMPSMSRSSWQPDRLLFEMLPSI